MEIGAANAASCHRYYDLAGAWGRQPTTTQIQLHAGAFENHGTHGLHHSFFQLTAGHPRSNYMRTDIGQPVRLKDYRPPDWLVQAVSLDVSLHPTAARVRARLALTPNLKAMSAPLILDGHG